MPSEPVAVRCRRLEKTYRTPSGAVRALREVEASFPAASLVAVAGPSGSGKSSLLRLIAGMDMPTSGEVVVSGVSVGTASARTRRRMRRDHVGFVFQRPSDNFVPHLSVGEHLARVAGSAEVNAVAEALGIAPRVRHGPAELSGGEQQRAAFAQAILGGARVVVADEPTAELDTRSGAGVLAAVRELRGRGITFVVATHDPAVLRAADLILRLDHGRVVEPRRDPFAASLAPVPNTAHDPDAPIVLEVAGLAKRYLRGTDVVHAVEDVSFAVRGGELVGLVGRSGSGKTTLLNLISGWERPDEGSITGPSERGSGVVAWRDLAVVPQKVGLLEELTVRENVAYPARLDGSLHEHRDRVEELLELLGLSALADRSPSGTSVGEQQRAAIARALVLRPSLVVADEPTGHQDRTWSDRVVAALRAACDTGTACVLATHDQSAVRFLDRALTIEDGRILAERSAGATP